MITVLVVEDEFIIRMDLADYLSDEGFEVIEAANADEAIEHLETNDQISIMFTDIDMPGSMDGLKLSAAVRDRWPPVIIVVTSGQREIAQTDLPSGSQFFTKPYDSAEIVSTFHELLAKSGQSAVYNFSKSICH